jgi:hypothetical protein
LLLLIYLEIIISLSSSSSSLTSSNIVVVIVVIIVVVVVIIVIVVVIVVVVDADAQVDGQDGVEEEDHEGQKSKKTSLFTVQDLAFNTRIQNEGQIFGLRNQKHISGT